ncbi:MobP2 family relaxase [Lysinibacillus capsici]|uniref:MobP2 family relaxase n=1 Tax=Lysinibacillus capsici TaxID=2115968 RepID=UPI002DBCE74B|nr:MobP2 family relaxase [Lysinibacillus capsici]MEC1305971.1 MobP2 family relaxase [Lysinibacillus capsici]
MTPGIVLKSKFVMPGTSEYKQYVNYINRDEAKYNCKLELNEKNDSFSLYYSYMDYMGDEEKQGMLFTQTDDLLSPADKKAIQQQFNKAQVNGSPLWQDVISFDNEWLVNNGLLNKDHKILDEIKIKSVVREAMAEMLERENMKDTAVWTAAIHYNTDNIHVHIATVEPIPTREKKDYLNPQTGVWEKQYRAKRKLGTLERMKSKIVNRIVDRTDERNQITNLIRGSVKKKKENVQLSTYRKTKRLFREALERLPTDRSQWQYAYQSINDARPYIDEIVTIYLDKFYQKEMKELHTLLEDEVKAMKEMYGEKSNYLNYKQTKLDDLKKRMGNAVLTEMRAYQKEADHRWFELSKSQRKYQAPMYRQNLHVSKGLNQALNNLNYRLRKTYHDFKKERNMEEFDRMLDGYER